MSNDSLSVEELTLHKLKGYYIEHIIVTCYNYVFSVIKSQFMCFNSLSNKLVLNQPVSYIILVNTTLGTMLSARQLHCVAQLSIFNCYAERRHTECCYAYCHYAKCHFVEYRVFSGILSVIILSVGILSVVVLSATSLSDLILYLVMLSIVMLSVLGI